MKPVRWLGWLVLGMTLAVAFAQEDVDSEESRKVLGSSVVTSVSVIMDHGNGTKTYITDAAGQPIDQTEGAVGSPVDLLNPDRYEFYTFDETGDLVKRLMTLDQIKGLLAGGDSETLDTHANSPTFYHESLAGSHLDDSDLEPHMAQGVHNVVASVQNVLRSELLNKKKPATSKPPLNIPDSISSWSMLFPPIISDSSEILDDGNSVSEPIDGGDRLSAASSNEEKVKIPEAVTESATSKPTAVPPIIHFLEIQSVPSPLKSPTKVPVSTSTTPVANIASTTRVPTTTTQKPTSPVNSFQEMSASISSLLSQVTDNQSSADVLNQAAENKLSLTSVPSPTTESVKQTQNVSDIKSSEKLTLTSESQLSPESSNLNTVTKIPESSIKKTESSLIKNKPQTISTTNKILKPTTQTTKVDSNKKTNVEANNTKKNPDAVVSLITTSKPVSSSALKNNPNITKSKPTSSVPTSTTKQKVQTSTQMAPVLITKNNVKTQATIQNNKGQMKKPVKPVTVKPDLNVETLEAHGSEGVIKVVPSKLSTPLTNKTKTNIQTKTNVNTSSPKPSAKPQKKVPNTKPPNVEHVHTPDCEHSKGTPSTSDMRNKEKLETAASTTQMEKIKPSKVKPVQQEVRIVPKPMAQINQISKPAAANKVKPSEEVKITTYKPSTSQPFTTKHSKNKLSTTTERPSGEIKVASESKIHEVNSSLLDIVKYLNKNDKLTATKIPPTKQSTSSALNNVNVTNYEVAASNTAETLTAVPAALILESTKNASSNIHRNNTDNHDHHGSECNHNKPQQSSIQDKIDNVNHDEAASNTEEVKVTTDSTESATEVTTDNPTSKDVTTEAVTEDTTMYLSTTPEVSEEKITDLPETTTLNMPEIDFVKEGISAVTNILLDENPNIKPQLMMPAMPLSESASNIDSVLSPPVKGELKHASSFDDMEMTTNDPTESSATESTERELTDATTITPTEVVPTTLESANNSSKISDDTTEQVTEAETTPALEETTTPSYEEIENKESSESKVVSIKQTLPTKESKLSPESNETALVTEPTVLCNHTLEQIKNSQADENITSAKDHLEPAQSVILEINNTLEEKTTPEPTTVSVPPSPPKTTTSSLNLDIKSALKQDPSQIKFSPAKYPNHQSSFRPVQDAAVNPSTAVELHPAPHESMGLEATTAFLADDVRRFSDLCNELAFRMWTSITGKGSISSRSLVLSPFATTSLLAMVFLGARGPTSGQMNDVLRLDDMVTFNPHQVLQNVTESVLNSRNYGVTTAAFVRELYSDKLKGKILDFYKERAQQYYDGHVEEISFNVVNDILRRRTNLLVKRQTLGKIPEYLRGSNLSLRPPLAAFSANIFQTDCDLASIEGRDGEMYFVVRPSTRQRRLVPVPAAVWRTGFLAGYEPGLDATAVALGTDSVVSTILVLPGQQGQVAPGDGLARLEQRLIETSYRRGGWTRLLRSLLPRPGLELQVPRFSHRSVLNVSSTLQRMGLKDLFNENKADLRGLNGFSNDLHLSDVVQINTFSTCGEDTIGARHHIETYPVSPQRMGRDEPELYPRPEDLDDKDITRVPLNLRPRQARLPDNPRLRFDRPFIYMVRHNPTGMILYMGRFNPRLLP